MHVYMYEYIFVYIHISFIGGVGGGQGDDYLLPRKLPQGNI